MRSERPSGKRVLHHAPPPVATRLTRSPSRTPLSRKAATAALARETVAWVRFRVSTMTAKRAARVGGRRRVGDEARPDGLGLGGSGHLELHRLEGLDGLHLALVAQGEVVLGQAGHGTAGFVRDHDVHPDELDVAREGGRRLLGRGRGRRWGSGLAARHVGGGDHEGHKGDRAPDGASLHLLLPTFSQTSTKGAPSVAKSPTTTSMSPSWS